MQPYFFPYLGYFALIGQVDHFVVFDSAQYLRRGWINRNRILHPESGWKYLTVPVVKAPQETRIRDIEIADPGWAGKLEQQLDHYRGKAPGYERVTGLLAELGRREYQHLATLNVELLKLVCDCLGVAISYSLASDIEPGSPGAGGPQERILQICDKLGANHYINLPGGRSLYQENRFKERNIELSFSSCQTMEYASVPEFVPDLSVLDVLMWNTPQETRKHLKTAKLTQ